MTASGHAIVGAAIGTILPNPLLSIPLAFLSHFVGDKLPHWDVMTDKNKTKKQVLVQSALDVIFSFALVALIYVYFLNVPNPIVVFLAAFSAQLPDWLEIPYFITGRHYPIFYQNYRLQSWVHDLWFNSRLKAPWGIITQIIVALIFICLAASK